MIHIVHLFHEWGHRIETQKHRQTSTNFCHKKNSKECDDHINKVYEYEFEQLDGSEPGFKHREVGSILETKKRLPHPC